LFYPGAGSLKSGPRYGFWRPGVIVEPSPHSLGEQPVARLTATEA